MLVTWHSASPFNRFFNSLELTLFNIFVFHILCITVSILQSAFLEIRVYDGYAATHQQGKKKREKKCTSLNIAVIISRCRQLSAISKKKKQKKAHKKTHKRTHACTSSETGASVTGSPEMPIINGYSVSE